MHMMHSFETGSEMFAQFNVRMTTISIVSRSLKPRKTFYTPTKFHYFDSLEFSYSGPYLPASLKLFRLSVDGIYRKMNS